MALTSSDLVDLLTLEPQGDDAFLGRCARNGWQRVFGGQVIAQALVAAQTTVADRAPHSLHAYFMLGGDPQAPIRYDVERLRDGRSFATRRVVARQHGEAIFALSASFQVDEAGLEHAIAMPPAPDPDTLPDPLTLTAALGEALRRPIESFLDRIRPIEVRQIAPETRGPLPPGATREPRQAEWIRIAGALPDDPALHRAALAYLSDLSLIQTVLATHGQHLLDGRFQVASLDHALWFHRPAKANEWLLYVQDSPSAQGARGLTHGSLFDRAGRLVASVAQEGLVRPRRDRDQR